jgi:hypothetical protein
MPKNNQFDPLKPLSICGLKPGSSAVREIELQIEESGQLIDFLQCCLWRSSIDESLRETEGGGLSANIPISVFENITLTLSKPGFSIQEIALALVEKSKDWRKAGIQQVSLVGQKIETEEV